MFPPGERFNRDFFIDEILERYDEYRSETRKRTDYMALLHIYNARPHLVQSKFDSMGIHRLPHPPYGPNIASCDF
jgi:hypothetical protein